MPVPKDHYPSRDVSTLGNHLLDTLASTSHVRDPAGEFAPRRRRRAAEVEAARRRTVVAGDHKRFLHKPVVRIGLAIGAAVAIVAGLTIAPVATLVVVSLSVLKAGLSRYHVGEGFANALYRATTGRHHPGDPKHADRGVEVERAGLDRPPAPPAPAPPTITQAREPAATDPVAAQVGHARALQGFLQRVAAPRTPMTMDQVRREARQTAVQHYSPKSPSPMVQALGAAVVQVGAAGNLREATSIARQVLGDLHLLPTTTPVATTPAATGPGVDRS